MAAAIETHGFGVLFGSSPYGGRVTMVGNLLAHIVERNPLSRAAELVFVNNLVYNRADMDVDLQSEKRPHHQELGRRQRVPARAELRPRHAADLRAHQRHATRWSPAAACTSTTTTLPATAARRLALVLLTGGDVISRPAADGRPCRSGTSGSRAPHGEQRRLQPRAASTPARGPRIATRSTSASSSNVKNRNGQIINCVSPNGATRCAKNARRLAVATRRITRTAHVAVESEHASRRTATPISRTGCTRWTRRSQGVRAVESPTSPPALSVQ